MVLYIYEKSDINISYGFQLKEQTRVHGRNGYVHCSKGNNFKSRQTRDTVHVFCKSSDSALLLVKFCENIKQTKKHSRNGYFYILCSKSCNSKSRLTSYVFFVFCMLSHGVLHL